MTRGTRHHRGILLLFLSTIADVCWGQLKGARMSWAVNPNFHGDTGTTAVRTVTLSITSAWVRPAACTIIPGQPVMNCDAEQNFGTLCWQECKNPGNGGVPSCSGAATCTPNLITTESAPTNLGYLPGTFFQGSFSHTVTVSPDKNFIVAYLNWQEASAPRFVYANGQQSDYWENFPSNLALFAPGQYPIVPTLVPLCTSVPEQDGASATCPLGRLTNYYSPVVLAPLVIASPQNAASTQAPVRLKTYDLDGHKLILLKNQFTSTATWADNPNTDIGSIFFDIGDTSLANGPKFLDRASVADRIVRLEVADRTYDSLEPLGLRTVYSSFSKWSGEQTAVQYGSSIVAPLSGKCTAQNPPPIFVDSTSSTTPISASYITEKECVWNSGNPGVAPCSIEVHARSPLAPSAAGSSHFFIKISSAFGFPSMEETSFGCSSNPAPCGCAAQDRKDCVYTPSKQAGATSNPFNLGSPWAMSDVGKVFVQCFVATSETRDSDTGSVISGPCPSLPMCVRVHVVGRKPMFIAPTPLELNSRDFDGTPFPARTDVGACLGSPLGLQLSAVDNDAGDSIRIFVLDVSTGQSNFDFFSDTPDPAFDATQLSACGEFGPYGARRVGNNANQTSAFLLDFPAASQPPASPSSVMAKIKPSVVYASGGSATQTIDYTLNLASNNGILARPPTVGLADVNEGQLLLNMDQMVCGAAFDNSRTRHKRWVGSRTVKSLPYEWLRSSQHALGDMASDLHCWLIKPQAPPQFVSDQSSACDNFVGNCQPARVQGQAGGAVRQINVASGQEVMISFVAADPNPADSVSMYVLEDPGLPPGMRVGRSTCMEQTDDFICRAKDKVSATFPMQNMTINFDIIGTSLCQRASLDLSWRPKETDSGQSFRVCVIGRDDSSLCYGKADKSATSRGWFGPQQCVDISVTLPQLSFTLLTAPAATVYMDVHAGQGRFGLQHAFVGCTFEFDVALGDTSLLYVPRIDATGQVPNGSSFAPGPSGCSTTDSAATCHKRFSWLPRRGTEGLELEVCFGASHGTSTTMLTGYCSMPTLSGSTSYSACGKDSDCTGGGVCRRSCILLSVQKCRYCVSSDNKLSRFVSDSGLNIKTNWLRLWTLHGRAAPLTGTVCRMVGGSQVCGEEVDAYSGDALIDNPELVERVPGQPMWAGTLLSLEGQGESLRAVASRFHTSVKELLSVNPLLNGDAQGLVQGEICVIPCTTTVVGQV